MEYEGAAVYRAVRARLTATSEAWGTRAYAELAPAGTAYPYVVYNVTGVETITGAVKASAVTVKITVTTDTLTAALSAAGRIAALFDNADHGGLNPLDGGDDWTIRTCTRIGGDQKTPLIDGSPIHQISLIYRMVLEGDEAGHATLTRVISFGGDLFPDGLISIRDNFADIIPQESRLPALDGAFTEGGATPAGRIDLSLMLRANSATELAAMRDDVRGWVGIGERDLVVEPSAGAAQRYTRARLIAASIAETAKDRPEVRLPAALTFAADVPRWFGVNTPTGSGSAQSISGTQTDFTRTANGNAISYPVITVNATSAISYVILQRLVSGVAIDIIAYMSVIPSGGQLIIDTSALTVKLNGVDAYTSAFSAAHPSWFRLLPGANTIRAIVGAGEIGTVTLTWRDTWV